MKSVYTRVQMYDVIEYSSDYVVVGYSMMVPCMQRVAQLQREGGLTISESPGPVQPHYTTATDDECRSNPSGDAPTLPFANYLHSQHDPVSPG